MGDLVESLVSRVDGPKPPLHLELWDLRGGAPLLVAVRSLIMLIFCVEDLLVGPMRDATHSLGAPQEAVDVLLTAAGVLYPRLMEMVVEAPDHRRGSQDQRSLLASLRRRAAHAQRAVEHRAKRSRQ